MANFFGLVAFFFALVMVVGLIKPKIALPRFLARAWLPSAIYSRIDVATAEPTRARVLIWYSGAIIATFLLAGILGGLIGGTRNTSGRDDYSSMTDDSGQASELIDNIVNVRQDTAVCQSVASGAAGYVEVIGHQIDMAEVLKSRGQDPSAILDRLDAGARTHNDALRKHDCI